MAYYSLQCVACQDATKRFSGEYGGQDEDGQRFGGPMYLCSNRACKINEERRRGEKQLRMIQADCDPDPPRRGSYASEKRGRHG